jgi:hypothetical protein
MARLRADDELSAERAAAEQRAGEREALLMRGRSEAQAQQRIRQAELRALEAEAERDAVPARIESAKQQAELDRLVAVLEVELRSLRAEIDREESRARVEIALADANVHRVVSDADAALTLAQKLPELAQAIGQRMGPVHVTAVGADANPMAHVAASIGALLELARGVKSQ